MRAAGSFSRRGARVAAAAALLLLACDLRTNDGSPNVIVYLVDTLRADRLGLYGHERDTSPRLEAIAAEAIVFEQAHATSSWTRPSTASLFTGLYPVRHRAVGRADTIAGDVPMLAEVLRDAGYATRAFVTNPNVLPLWGFDRGFDTYVDLGSETSETDAEVVVDAVLRELDGLAHDAPFYLYVHTIDPHGPYEPPPPYDRLFAERPTRRERYDAEIAYSDAQLGRLADHLRETGRWDDTILVFVSDHGEEFFDHGQRDHGHALFQESVRVPLVVKLRDGERGGARIDEPVSIVDVMPTVLDAAGLRAPEGIDGVSLLPLVRGDAPAPGRALHFDLTLEWPGRIDVQRAVRIGPRKYIRRLRPEPAELLYDLAADPAEQADRFAADPATGRELSTVVDEHRSESAAGLHVRVVHPPGLKRRLQRLELETAGRFEDLARWRLEEEDGCVVSPDASALACLFVADEPRLLPGEVSVEPLDRDGIALRIDPPEAGLTIRSLESEGTRPLAVHLGAGRRVAPPPPLALDGRDRVLAVDDVAVLLEPASLPGVYVAVARSAERRETIPDDVRARLEALGYLEPDAAPADPAGSSPTP